MAWNGTRVLAVIPARGGSKAIPRKNLATIDGVTLVARAATFATALDWVDEAVISTDDEEIMAEAVAHGLDAPFIRPDDLAADTATSASMWRHSWLAAENHYQTTFELSVLLEPTSPHRRPEDVERTVSAVVDGGRAAAATVNPTPAHYTPHKTLTVDDSNTIGFYLQGGARHSLRQTIPQYYHRNGLCYAVTRTTLIDHAHILEHDCAAVVIDRPVVNIDDAFDLELARILLTRETT